MLKNSQWRVARAGWPGLCCAVLAATLACSVPQCVAQIPGQSKGLPRADYYASVGQVYQGEYRNAAKSFRSYSRTAYKDVNGFFMDSVCYWTMLGECAYHLGEYEEAISQYEAALELYLNLQAWPSRTQFPPSIQTDAGALQQAKRVNWATSGRSATVGAFGDGLLVFMGRLDNERVLRDGGVWDPARLRRVDVAEVMRCVALAMHRRRLIKGDTCKYDPFTKRVASALAGGGGGTIAGAWQGVVKGIAYANLDEWGSAATTLQGSLQVVGNYDHPLTPLALLEMGYAAQALQNWEQAQQLFLEASLTGALFQQYDVVEESLRQASNVFAMGRTNQPFPPLEGAVAWAKREGATPVESSLLVQAAMLAAESSTPSSAETLLDQARRAMGRSDVIRSAVMTRWHYVTALTKYSSGDMVRGDDALTSYFRAASQTSLRLYQVQLADQAVISNTAGERDAELLYDAVLGEPTDLQWSMDPMDTLAFLATPRVAPLERWFEIALGRKAEDKAIGIAELIRRQRFFSSLPLGGRLVGLRWVLDAPDAALTPQAIAQKQQLLIRYPGYKELSETAERLRSELEQLPLTPEDGSPEEQQQKVLLTQLGDVTQAQEQALRQMALLREPCQLCFPPPLSTADVLQKLSDRQLVVSMLKIGQRYYVMTLGAGRYAFESLVPARSLDREIRVLLTQLGVGERTAVLGVETFASDDWRENARTISELLFAKTDPNVISSLDEIIFVPDGVAWYMPMELLQYGPPEQSVNINQKVKVRYAPTVALAVPDERTGRRFRRSAIVVDRNFGRDDPAMMQTGLEAFQQVLPDVMRVEKTTAGPSSFLAGVIDQLFVWHESADVGREVFALAPLNVDQGKPGGDLASWMLLPWRGVAQMVLTGYSSNAEGSGRNRADGQELFLTTTGLMASGTRSVLISRWRVGGQTTLDLSREYALLLGDHTASEAWQRSVRLLVETELDLNKESRVRSTTLATPLKAEHPYFWAGYMLVDTGFDPTDTGSTGEDGSDQQGEGGAADGGDGK